MSKKQIKTELKQFFKHMWYAIFNHPPYAYLGSIILPFIPKTYRMNMEVDFFSGNAPKGMISHLVRSGINAKYYSSSDEQKRKMNREYFWGAESGRKWHDFKKKIYSDKNKKEEYIRHRKPLLSQILELCSNNSEFNTVCEVGTGNGMFLDYLSKNVQGVDNFIGVDLNKEQISENQRTYNNKLQFVHSEIMDYLHQMKSDNVIIVAIGTFEYFTEEELRELFDLLKSKFKYVAIAIHEPINLDLNSELSSKPRGNIAYSHNYPYLVEHSGYTIFKKDVQPINPNIPFYNTVIMVSTYFKNSD